MSSKHRPGELVPRTDIYRILDSDGCPTDFLRKCFVGDRFPPAPAAGYTFQTSE